MLKKFSPRQIVFIALLVSLNVVLTRIASVRIPIDGIEGIRVGIGLLPVLLAGVMFGPVIGGVVGALGDVLGYQINPFGPYFPCFTLTAALAGCIPAIIVNCFRQEKRGYYLYLFAIAVGQIITSVILVPYFLQLFFHIPLIAVLPGRIISQIITIPVYAYFITVLVRRIPQQITYKS